MGKPKTSDKESKKALLDDSDSSSDSDSDSSSSSSSSAASNNKDLLPVEDQKHVSFSINSQYAKDYQSRKQREELLKERTQYDDNDEDEDDSDASSDSSSEDEDADLLTTKLDVDILKTINALRTKDEKIYNPTVRFFAGSEEESSSEDDDEAGAVTKKSKPKRVKDVLREQILEQMEEEDSDNENNQKKKKKTEEKTERLAYDEQQQELRKAFLDTTADKKSSQKDNDSDDDDTSDSSNNSKQEDDFLVLKKRHTNEDPSETKQIFESELKNLEDSVLQQKEKQLVDPRGEVEDGDKFLLDFIKNKTWIDKNDYDGNNNDSDDDASLEQLEQADDFEAKYNFRFEEAVQHAAESTSGADMSVRGYARSQTMNTLRRKDDSRREKRLARKERKAAERKAKEEKLRRLKNAKREEMEQKLKQVKAVLGAVATTGAENSGDPKKKSKKKQVDSTDDNQDDDLMDALNKDGGPIDEAAIMKLLEGDYDPDKFEKSMQAAFGDDFYEKEDAEWKTDEDVQDALKKDGEVDYVDYDDADNEDMGEAEHDGDEEYYNDEEDDYEADDDGEHAGGGEETELEKKVRAKMQDKLYELDYEDIVAGMPTRFKYREVERNNYGLTTEEILLARDQTLKQYVSLKKMAPYREDGEYQVSSRKRRKFREQLKEDVEEAERRLKEQGITVQDNHEHEDAGDDSGATKKKKRRRLKKSGDKSSQSKEENKPSEVAAEPVDSVDASKSADDTTEDKKTKRRRKKKGKKISSATSGQHNEDKYGAADEATIAVVPTAKQTVPKVSPPEDDASVPKMSPLVDDAVPAKTTDEKKKAKKKKQKAKKKKLSVEGVSAARLSSYGL